MKIENAKKIEVWEFEDELVQNILVNGVVYFLDDEGNYTRRFNNKKNTECIKLLAELEAEKQESESSEWVEFHTPSGTPIIPNGHYRTKNGIEYEFKCLNDWYSTKYAKEVKAYYEENKDAILKANGKPKQEEPTSTIQGLPESTLQLTLNEDYLKELVEKVVENKAKSSTTDNLLEVIHNLEKRIEALESELSKANLPYTDLRIATLEQRTSNLDQAFVGMQVRFNEITFWLDKK